MEDGDLRLETGDWRLETGDWRLEEEEEFRASFQEHCTH